MPAPDRTATAPRPVDPVALTRWRERLREATEPPWLHTEAARRMAERLALVKLQPSEVIDWGLQPRHDRALLSRAYPKARLQWVDPDARAASAASAPWWRRWRGTSAAPAALSPASVVPGGAQLLWSAMLLHTLEDPQAQFGAWHRALAVDGFLMFCTFGPGTLASLSALYAREGWGPPLAPLVDMHDLGDMLVQAGFADPVMDQETLHLTWRDSGAALAELSALGLNAAPGRTPGLRTPRWRERLLRALDAGRTAEGRVTLSFELVYGHAFKPVPRVRVAAETAVAVDDLRTMARRRQGPLPGAGGTGGTGG